MNQSPFWWPAIKRVSVFSHLPWIFTQDGTQVLGPTSLESRKAIYQATKETSRCWFIFPYSASMPGKWQECFTPRAMNPICLLAAAWSTALRRILNLHFGFAGKHILKDKGCPSWGRDKRWHLVIYDLDDTPCPPHPLSHASIVTCPSHSRVLTGGPFSEPDAFCVNR